MVGPLYMYSMFSFIVRFNFFTTLSAQSNFRGKGREGLREGKGRVRGREGLMGREEMGRVSGRGK